MIELEGVNLTFRHDGQTSTVLSDISFSIAEGESCAIIGPSGCGKTSLLFLLAGIYEPTAGTVQMGNRQQCGTILQHFGLLPWKTVTANIGLGLQLKGIPRLQIATRVAELIDEMGLNGFENYFPGQLSGGMQQRVAMARALAVNPRVLLMDEPLSALDALTRERLQNLILEIWRSKHLTAVLVTHSIEEAVFLGRRIIVLSSRPCHILTIVDNRDAGRPDYRQSATFFHQCTQLRTILRAACNER
jgi:ABC-type nitrate/sulfonate/bicarbonate transport system ATPase subunit